MVIRKLKHVCRILKIAYDVAAMGEVPRAWDIDQFVSSYKAVEGNLTESSSLDIGCGMSPWNPFQAAHVFGIDIRVNENKNVRCADLTIDAIPFPDRSFDYVTAGDFIEHVPRVIYAPNHRFPFVCLMNEIWRVLKPNGLFFSRTPVYPFSAVFRDPTHVNLISHETFPLYFDNNHRLAAKYGFVGAFNILDQGVCPPHLLSLLQRCN